ncbi:MAG: AAA family ATPase, partial [Anaerolineaceae bacterium]
LFSEFVGMSHLKEEVCRQASFIKVQQMRREKNITVAASPSRHMVFKGNPGTGKTTVARVIADIYHELGVLDTNNVVETDRSGLIAEYLGQTAVKTREVIESAIGGVLFIDEAYSLTEQSNDYGSEAVDMLLKMMEDHRDNLVVIVAGYGDEMDSFISSNPGLSSRFNRYMDFPDYAEEELWEILLKLCKANSYIIQDQTLLKSRMMKEFKLQKLQQGEYFGNARYVRNLFEKAIENQSYRLIKEFSTDYVSLQVLQPGDFFA